MKKVKVESEITSTHLDKVNGRKLTICYSLQTKHQESQNSSVAGSIVTLAQELPVRTISKTELLQTELLQAPSAFIKYYKLKWINFFWSFNFHLDTMSSYWASKPFWTVQLKLNEDNWLFIYRPLEGDLASQVDVSRRFYLFSDLLNYSA